MVAPIEQTGKLTGYFGPMAKIVVKGGKSKTPIKKKKNALHPELDHARAFSDHFELVASYVHS